MEPYRDLGTYEGASGFAGAIGKLVRARYQLRELNERFEKFAESHPYRLRGQFEAGAHEGFGDYSFIVESVSVPKREWGVLIGELVHNLRSALDHAVYAAAEKPGGHTQFPIHVAREDWEKKAPGRLRSVPADVVKIVEQAQPCNSAQGYEPKAHVLAVLNRLSNYDKHRLLHTAVLTLNEAAPSFHAKQDVAAIYHLAVGLGRLEPGETIARVTIRVDGPEPQIDLYGEFAFSVAFTDPLGRDQILEERPVMEVLMAAYHAVHDLVIRIEIACTPPACSGL